MTSVMRSFPEAIRLWHEVNRTGLHQVRINATHLPPGVYLYSMSTPYFNESRRMMLIR